MYMKTAFLRDDVRDNLTELLVRGIEKTAQDDKTKDYMLEFMIRVISNEKVKDATLESLLYQPLWKIVTLGFGGPNETDKQTQD